MDDIVYQSRSAERNGQAAGAAARVKKPDPVNISLEPEFKGISKLLGEITKYRIINENDLLASIKISRALFQAFVKYKISDSKKKDFAPEAEMVFKKILSFLIEVEENRLPDLSALDKPKKSHKSVQCDDLLPKEVVQRAPVDMQGGIDLDLPKGLSDQMPMADFDSPMSGRPRARSRSRSRSPARDSYHPPLKRPSSPSRRFIKEDANRNLGYERSMMPESRDPSYNGRQMRDNGSPSNREARGPLARNFDLIDQPGGQREEFDRRVISTRIINGCKVSRIIKARQPSNGLSVPRIMQSEDRDVFKRDPLSPPRYAYERTRPPVIPHERYPDPRDRLY